MARIKYPIAFGLALLLFLLWFRMVFRVRSGEAESIEAVRRSVRLDIEGGLNGFPSEGPIHWEEDTRSTRWSVRLVGKAASLEAVRFWADDFGEPHEVREPRGSFEVGETGEMYFAFFRSSPTRSYRIKVYENGRFQIQVYAVHQ